MHCTNPPCNASACLYACVLWCVLHMGLSPVDLEVMVGVELPKLAVEHVKVLV